MRRLAAIDWLLLGTLLPLCLLGLASAVIHGVRGDFVMAPFLASSAPDPRSYPIVSGVLGPLGVEFATGDRVLRLEGRDLRGLSVFGYLLQWSAIARSGAPSLTYTIEHGGAPIDIRAPFIAGGMLPGVPWWASLPFILALVATGVLLLIRGAHWHLARRWYVACLLTALAVLAVLHFHLMPRAFVVAVVFLIPLVCGLTLQIVHELIPGLRLWNRWRAALTWTLSLTMSVGTAAFLWLPDTGFGATLIRAGALASAGCGIACPIVLTEAYRRAEPLGRRQIKWIVFGFYVGLVPLAAFFAVYAARRWPQWLAVLLTIAMIAAAAAPLGVLVAVAFYRFLDIDRLFGATLSYSALAILAIASMLAVMPTGSRAASDAFGLAPANSQLLLALAMAAIVFPAQRAVRPRIDRLLFPERLTLEQGIGSLLSEVSTCADMQDLTRLIGERLDELMRPACVVVYARNADEFAAIVVRGRVAPPAFAAHTALIAALHERSTPIAAERWTQRRTTALTPFERAALETLDVAVLVPFHRGAQLVAFACLGPKRSGDIYTPTDLALVGAVAGKMSERLQSLDAAAMAEQARAMQDKLRRYVPSAVADRITSGHELEAAEREVTVLFVDIRGYTGLSERREAEEMFDTVNRFTEVVSRIVQARRGVVVEFHGDGLLAVFGAPEEIAMKEGAAVQAARQILASMTALCGDTATPTLSVGVGITTGPAFVGNIQSADRFIWTVIGNTVNLAARLQSLTRDFGAAIAIDDTTFQRAGAGACSDFVRHADVSIRGRTQLQTVYALPL